MSLSSQTASRISPRKRLGLRSSMFLVFGGLSVIVIIGISLVRSFGLPFMGITGEYQDLKAQAVNELSLIADLKKEHLKFWLKERQGDLSVLAANEQVRRDLSGLVKGVRDYQEERQGKEPLADPQSMPEFLRLKALLAAMVENYESIEAVHAVDPASGVIVASSDTGLSGRALPDKAPFNAVLRSSTGTGVWILPGDRNQKKNYLKFACVVSAETDGGLLPMAVLISRVGIDEFVQPMLYTGGGLDRTGEVVLVDHDQRILAPLKYPLPDGREARVLKHRIEALPASLAARGKEGILFSKDYRGVPVLAAYRHLRVNGGIGWGMVVKQDMSEILGPLWKRIIVSSLVGLVGILAFLAGSAIVARRLGAPLRALARTASAVRKGDFSVRAKETGTREVYQLAGIFNSMADRLQNWNKEMEREIAQKTRRLAEELEARTQSEARYRALIESSLDHLFMLDPKGKFIASNDRVSHFGLTNGNELVGKTLKDIYPPDVLEICREKLEEVLRTGRPVTFEHDLPDPSGRVIHHLDTLYPGLRDKEIWAVGGICKDITELKKTQAQFLQAQKMEVVGRLAGGVAHDYNNALSVIVGFTELAIDEVDPTGPVHANLGEVLKAAKRATDITRQLLAFARKQTIAPKVLDLNENVESMLKMLRRLIGEDINLAWLPGASLWPVKMDPSQIDQILVNLCVNARDAIENVGKLSIETSKVAIDSAYCADHDGFVPGEFVLLAVSDNGCGMDKEILGNIFEPFFTTKDIDKGTGLGMATVYGIVKQNNGFINVYSEPGKGTTIKIYLPRHEGDAVEVQDESVTEIPQGQGETILLVEDDLSLLNLASKILEGLGYTVLTSEKPDKVMGLAEEHPGKIHLLITDVIMPEMNGRELAEQLQSLYPDIKCVFMSGYTADIIAHHGVLKEGVKFIQKPFSKRDLATTVRKALDEAKVSA